MLVPLSLFFFGDLELLELMEADNCFICSRRKDRRDNSFSCFICSRRKGRRKDRRKDRWNGFWLCLSFVQSTEIHRQKGLRMKERLIGVADDRMIERVFLI